MERRTGINRPPAYKKRSRRRRINSAIRRGGQCRLARGQEGIVGTYNKFSDVVGTGYWINFSKLVTAMTLYELVWNSIL